MNNNASPPSKEPFSIQIPRDPKELPCALCAEPFHVDGPTGYLGDRPVCDACLCEHHEELGLVMAMLATCRRYGNLVPEDPADDRVMGREILTYVRLYARQTSDEWGPQRSWEPVAERQDLRDEERLKSELDVERASR